MLKLSMPGQAFSMEVVGYEFPDEELGPTEDNPADDFRTARFLNIAIEFSHGDRTWRTVQPEMTTTDLLWLADWLQMIADGTCSELDMNFTEYYVKLTVDAELTTLRVKLFFSKPLPPWAKGGDSLHLDFPLTYVDLAENIRSLRNDLERFPGLPLPPEAA